VGLSGMGEAARSAPAGSAPALNSSDSRATVLLTLLPALGPYPTLQVTVAAHPAARKVWEGVLPRLLVPLAVAAFPGAAEGAAAAGSGPGGASQPARSRAVLEAVLFHPAHIPGGPTIAQSCKQKRTRLEWHTRTSTFPRVQRGAFSEGVVWRILAGHALCAPFRPGLVRSSGPPCLQDCYSPGIAMACQAWLPAVMVRQPGSAEASCLVACVFMRRRL
jgi:hypothetical protein